MRGERRFRCDAGSGEAALRRRVRVDWAGAGRAGGLTAVLAGNAVAAHAAPPSVIAPGGTVAALYGLLFAASLLPAVYAAGACLFVARRHREDRAMQSRCATGLVASCALVGLAAGYGWEAMQTRVKLAPDALEYRNAGQQARVPWDDVQEIELSIAGKRQLLRVADSANVVRIDLTAFAPEQRQVLVKRVPEMAHMPGPSWHNNAVWVWRRLP